MTRLWILTFLATFLTLPAPGFAQVAPDSSQRATNSLPGQASLLPGDVIRVRIWREEDLSGEFQVDSDGYVVLPLLGKKRVVGISPDVLRDQLTDEYSDYLVNTGVNVTLLRRVTILGEVRLPGQYQVDATQSVADLIARAQGLTPDGNADDIVLLRDGEQLRTTLNSTLTIQDAGIRSGDRVMVGKRSWLSRNLSSLVGVASIIANVVVIVTR